ncbi:MAG: hypothetical protein M1818_002052 [Claussenomyces sp. TS43310]|nr:MAG: hypothetical protein M1818_002052 [Claussenomyces sp. TS43310]
MPPTSTLLRSARPLFQNANHFTFSTSTRTAFRSTQFQNAFARSTARAGRRFQSTDAAAGEAATKSWFARMWDSPVGLKTWALVIAGIADFNRPAEKLSLTQNIALTATGAIWTRWCLIIQPRNVLLAAVNFFLGCVGVVQVSRILAWQYSDKGESPKEQLEAAKDSTVEAAKGVKEDVKAALPK